MLAALLLLLSPGLLGLKLFRRILRPLGLGSGHYPSQGLLWLLQSSRLTPLPPVGLHKKNSSIPSTLITRRERNGPLPHLQAHPVPCLCRLRDEHLCNGPLALAQADHVQPLAQHPALLLTKALRTTGGRGTSERLEGVLCCTSSRGRDSRDRLEGGLAALAGGLT